jgi:hypothetical protein
MSEQYGIKCRGLAGHGETMHIMLCTEKNVYVLDVENEVCLGQLAVDSSASDRICFGPKPGTCLIGSWLNQLKAWSYAEKKILWELKLNQITSVEPYAKPGKVKVKKAGTIILDFETGAVEQKYEWEEVFFHPGKGHVNGQENKAITFEALNGRIFQTPHHSFAMMTHAWSEDVFVWGTPEGHLSGYSWNKNQLLFDLKPDFWFNVCELAWSGEENMFYGLASDWDSEVGYGLFSLEAETGKIELLRRLPNEPHHAFIKKGEYLVLSDGGLYNTRTGELVKQMDLPAICIKPAD